MGDEPAALGSGHQRDPEEDKVLLRHGLVAQDVAVCMRGWWPSQGDTGEGWRRPDLQAASPWAGWGPESVLCSGCW